MPVFMQPWWMDAVCAGKEWDVLLVESQKSKVESQDGEGEIIGAMPYLLRKRAWLKYIIMPQQTQIGGIWVREDVTGDKWKTAEVCRALKEQLDGLGLAYYYQQYMPGSLCVDAMRGLGFKTKERVTYRVDDLSDLDALIASFSKNKRRQLQKALSLHAERGMEVEDFYRFHVRCMAARKRKIRYSREFLLVLERKARRKQQCEILKVCNADGSDIAEEIDTKIKLEKLRVILSGCLDEREKKIIERRYGLYGGEELTQRDIAKKLGISRSYVSRIEKSALEKLRRQF